MTERAHGDHTSHTLSFALLSLLLHLLSILHLHHLTQPSSILTQVLLLLDGSHLYDSICIILRSHPRVLA